MLSVSQIRSLLVMLKVYRNLNVDTSLEEKTFEGIAYVYITSTVQAQWSYTVRVPNLAMLYRNYHVLVFAPNPNELWC